MEMYMLSRKRGESLVEVIVALGIFAFIFMGVMNIVIGSITLNLASSQRTEAVSKVQMKLNRYLAGHSSSGACAIASRAEGHVAEAGFFEGITGCEVAGGLTDATQKCYWVTVEPLTASEKRNVADTVDLPGSVNFVKVTSNGKWYTKILGEQKFSVSRMVKK
jgi:Tfp pilus assembly protein PilV